MEWTEKKVFILLVALVTAVALILYSVEYHRLEGNAPPLTTSIETPTTNTTVIQATTTIAKPLQTTKSSVTSTTKIKQTTSTTTTLKPTTTVPAYIAKYAGKGYRQAYIDARFFCPSCVPTVSRIIQDESGVIANSMSYRQKVNWVIYDPKKVTVERIVTLAGSGGDAVLLNDTAIP